MSKHKLSLSEARKDFFHLPQQFEEQPEGITVTHHDKPVMAILPINTYKLLLETIDRVSRQQPADACRSGSPVLS